tara:strand:- start:227 stop:433 length:207 start_codon:yes stop_codon:yes gene_type:complete
VEREIEIGDLVRMARNPDAYGKRSEIVGLVVGFVKTTSALWGTPGVCAKVEWTNGVETVSGLPVLELV